MTQDAFAFMPETQAGPSRAARGVIGDRHLTAVQTFDIARLTTHPVPLVPGSFVAVSGIGPKGDSNGSGKTSFLAAVSLLLGEAQWRLEGNGAQYAANLLFKPESAGLGPEHRWAPADRGFIIGVFGDPGDAATTVVTVWMRIASTPPYLKVRWTYGLHVTIANTPQARDDEAETLWSDLPRAQELGPRNFATELYGEAPRCMAYLDTPMRPTAPSLLSQQMTEMTPEQLGTALIELTGRQGLLETELVQRGRLADQQETLRAKQVEDEKDRIREQTDLDAVGSRDRSREYLKQGESLWRLHFAKGLLGAHERDAMLGEQIARFETEAADHQQQLDHAKADLDSLLKRKDLDAELAGARVAHERADTDHRTATNNQFLLKNELSKAVQRRNELVPFRSQVPILELPEARNAVEKAEGSVLEHKFLHHQAKEHRDQAKRDLAAARAGQGGPAAESLAALESAGLTAVSLLDSINLDEAARPAWEPRLWPYQSAVVVGPEHENAALQALSEVAGAILLTADASLSTPPASLPTGVMSDLPVDALLKRIAARTEHRSGPDRAYDEELNGTTVGGFPAPISGRAARIAAAEAALELARVTMETAATRLGIADLELEAAEEALTVAEAIVELGNVEEQKRALEEELDAMVAELAGLAEELDRTLNAMVAADTAVRTLQQQIGLANALVVQLRRKRDDTAEKCNDLAIERDRLRLHYWVAGWGDTPAAAAELLAAQEEDIRRLQPRSLRHRAAEKLKDALDAYGRTSKLLPPELAEAQQRRQRLIDKDPGVGGDDTDFTTIARPLRDLLDSRAEHDQILEARILRTQGERTERLGTLEHETGLIEQDLHSVQDMISSRVEAALDKIGTKLNELNKARGLWGAELRVNEIRPATATSPWKWEVVPRWKRSPQGGMVSYREVANGAQVKVFAIELVLAALLAAEGSRGRVLVLDELGNSLGDVNRRDVLHELNKVAARQDVTILATCQDSVIGDAAGECGEILWFCHHTDSDAYNLPTRAWGYDPDGKRVELVRSWLITGRAKAGEAL
ncbi:hypothetical protein [Micromonospora zamorensis]|uniref:hypothetical protein n=1 Tax=Micromonospora zamorensis TaxID=709883 RepID=UPI002E1939F3